MEEEGELVSRLEVVVAASDLDQGVLAGLVVEEREREVLGRLAGLEEEVVLDADAASVAELVEEGRR